jgi:hypothetical protein
MGQFRLAPSAIAFALVAIFCQSTATATTLIPVADDDLTVSVSAIVEGRVVSTDMEWQADRGAVYSYVTVDVERSIKGRVPPGYVVLRQLGGEAGEHVTVVYGAPKLETGRRVLLFLNTDDDGVLHVAHLGFGEFWREVDSETGADVLVRPGMDGVDVLPSLGKVTTKADHDAFVRSIERTLVERSADVARYDDARIATLPLLVPAGYTPSNFKGDQKTNYRFLGSGFRWFEFDSKVQVPVRVNPSAAPGGSGGFDEVKNAISAWDSVTQSSVRLKFSGKTKVGGLAADTVNSVAFGDPRHEIDDPVNCTGIVAQSGITNAIAESVTVNGKVFQRIAEADIVFNNNFDCLIGNQTVLTESITHEMGHTLGLGHSSENLGEPDATLKDATMFFAIHNDGRGAAVRADDSAGLRFIYPNDAGSNLLVTSPEVADAVPSHPYAFDLTAKGGASPYTWTVVAGRLPVGLSLSREGHITGTPSVEGVATFTVGVRDANGASVEERLSIAVTNTPAPFLGRAVYSASAKKLILTGRYLDTTASVSLNGSPLAVELRLGRPKGDDVRLNVKASANALGLHPEGTNRISLVIGGRASNEVGF